ncbi:MAG: stage II sporulation protein M [Deltaproteobacteria bacterium]|nr:stage II sporulation protein M [Deltaproteobacteria bacterium]
MLPQTRLQIQQDQNLFQKEFQQYLKDKQAASNQQFASTFNILKKFERLTRDYYQLEADCPRADPLRIRSKEFLADATQALLLEQLEVKEKTRNTFLQRYRQIWRDHFPLFLFTLALFIFSTLFAWHMTIRDPHYALAFMGEDFFDTIKNKDAWFEKIVGMEFLEGFAIAQNNIQVTLNCFLGGAFFGLGGLFFLVYNGFHLGSVFAFCRMNHFDDKLLQFITGHGFLELSIIVAGCFASLVFGRVFYQRPYKLFRKRLYQATKDAGIIILGITPWLVLAALVESFVSPQKSIPFPVKMGISLLIGGVFWAWTLWPPTSVPNFSNADKPSPR